MNDLAGLFEKIWARGEEQPTGCRYWTGATAGEGYGSVYWRGKKLYVHRAMWAMHFGPIPAGMVIRHTCDNPLCHRLNHLRMGTTADNVADKIDRQRQQRGGMRFDSKLTDADVAAILVDGRKLTEIAEDYGVTFQHISNLKLGKRWRHLSPRTASS